MSKAGKILFAFSVVAFMILGSARLIYGGWDNSMWVPFVLMIVFFLGAVGTDYKAINEMLRMRTTKHGLNMGALIAIVIVGLACVNYLAGRYDKKFDWTSDRFNSLSEQSVKAASSLKAPTELILLYRKDAQGGDTAQKQAQSLFDMYHPVNSQITYKAYDGLQRPDLAQKYEFTAGPFVFYAVQGDGPTMRKVKIDPVSEEGITRALIKLGRDKKKIVYFTRGHGELLLDQKDATGLTDLKDDLSVTYDVRPLALFETKNEVPADADTVAVVGPKQQFLEAEINALRDYARRGGHLLLALDPGTRQNLAQLARTFGVDFANNYVLDLRSRALQSSPTLVLGNDFSHESEITKAMPSNGNAFVLFELASSLKKASDAPASLTYVDLVQTDKSTATVPEIKEQIEYRANGPHTLAMSVSGKLGKDATKDFEAVLIGDSDFMANRLLHNNLNRDLVENAFAWLTNDADLISIRPKQPKGSRLDMPTGSFYALVLALLMMSLALFGAAVGFWWRRRTA